MMGVVLDSSKRYAEAEPFYPPGGEGGAERGSRLEQFRQSLDVGR